MSSSNMDPGDPAKVTWLGFATMGVVALVMAAFGLLGTVGYVLFVLITFFAGFCSLALAGLAFWYLRTSSKVVVRLYWTMLATTLTGLSLIFAGGLPWVRFVFTGDPGRMGDKMRMNLLTGPALLFFFLAPLFRRPKKLSSRPVARPTKPGDRRVTQQSLTET